MRYLRRLDVRSRLVKVPATGGSNSMSDAGVRVPSGRPGTRSSRNTQTTLSVSISGMFTGEIDGVVLKVTHG